MSFGDGDGETIWPGSPGGDSHSLLLCSLSVLFYFLKNGHPDPVGLQKIRAESQKQNKMPPTKTEAQRSLEKLYIHHGQEVSQQQNPGGFSTFIKVPTTDFFSECFECGIISFGMAVQFIVASDIEQALQVLVVFQKPAKPV